MHNAEFILISTTAPDNAFRRFLGMNEISHEKVNFAKVYMEDETWYMIYTEQLNSSSLTSNYKYD